ncbi:MAG: DUF3617 domain-containing protein [Sphingomonas sp.]|uniref:DUF3617 domain-containing protein n=1 Tax=Sphingomonas sp. TaxID=28214 RepID=UPI003F8200B5
MRTTPLIIVATAFALTACGQKTSTSTTTINSETGTVTTTGDAPTTATSLGLQPGKWESTTTTLELTTTGMPANMPKEMIPQKPAPQTVTACLTPEQASKGPGELLQDALAKLKAAKFKVDCSITNSTFAGGKILSEASCQLPTGTMTTKTSGTYSATEATYDSEASVKGGPITSVTKTHTVSHRVGECS